MTWKSNPLPKSKPAKPSKIIQPEDLVNGLESGEQSALFCWAALNVGKYPQLDLLFAVPNGGSRHKVEAINLVAQGLRKGVCDIFLAWPMNIIQNSYIATKWYGGLFIELKIEKRRKEKTGGVSADQIKWIDKLLNAGYYVSVCYSWQEARDVIINYLEGKL